MDYTPSSVVHSQRPLSILVIFIHTPSHCSSVLHAFLNLAQSRIVFRTALQMLVTKIGYLSICNHHLAYVYKTCQREATYRT